MFQAQAGGFRARWTHKINEEWVAAVLKKRPGLSKESLARTLVAMNDAVLDCIVDGYEDLVDCLELPDKDDRHVLAAAIIARANVIVTFNEKDFPREKIETHHIHTKHPDDFLLDLASISQNDFVVAAAKDFDHYKKPASRILVLTCRDT